MISANAGLCRPSAPPTTRAQRDAARKQAVELLVGMPRDHPAFEKADAGYYCLAVELTALGNAKAGRASLQKLLDSFSDSPLAGHAREALGIQAT